MKCWNWCSEGDSPQLSQVKGQTLILDLEQLCSHDLSCESECFKRSLCAFIVLQTKAVGPKMLLLVFSVFILSLCLVKITVLACFHMLGRVLRSGESQIISCICYLVGELVSS